MARHNGHKAQVQAQALIELRRRREVEGYSSADMVGFWREWAMKLWPEEADGIAALPDAAFRPTHYHNPEGYGQDSEEVRRRFLEIIEAAEYEDEREENRER